MRALLVQPATPKTYWGFQYSLPLTGRAVSLPPLGLISLAALLPPSWELRLVDLNADPLRDEEIRWADAVLVTGMLAQSESIHQALARARRLGRRSVLGGPAVTTHPEAFGEADHLFQGEAEGRIEALVRVLASPGAAAPRVLSPVAGGPPEMAQVPVPRFDLVDPRRYVSMSIQYSRGCPFRCEFCDIVEIFGRRPRVKSAEQILTDLQAVYDRGYRGSLFFVDDNFIGNRKAVGELLPRIADWQARRGWPFELYTEASVDLASHPELVRRMVAAGFSSVFLGLESPSTAALKEAGKYQNLRLPPEEAVRRLTRAGIEIYAGFIVGFDSDGPGIFEEQERFISSLPIPLAMVGVLSALPGTALWKRLGREGRLRGMASGDQFDRPNFEPVLDEGLLLSGYARLLEALYAPQAYYARCEQLLDEIGQSPGVRSRPGGWAILLRTAFQIGLRAGHRRHFWRLLLRTLRRDPRALPRAIGLAVKGEHLIRYTRDVLLRLERACRSLGGPSVAASAPVADGIGAAGDSAVA